MRDAIRGAGHVVGTRPPCPHATRSPLARWLIRLSGYDVKSVTTPPSGRHGLLFCKAPAGSAATPGAGQGAAQAIYPLHWDAASLFVLPVVIGRTGTVSMIRLPGCGGMGCGCVEVDERNIKPYQGSPLTWRRSTVDVFDYFWIISRSLF